MHDQASTDRRRFLKSSLALGLALHGLPARAEAGGRVLFGYTPTPLLAAMMEAVMREMQPRYRPDLGPRPVYMPGNSGLMAMGTVIKAPADGATAIISTSNAMTLLPLVRRETIDPVDLLRPVAGIGIFCYAFIVGPAVPAEVKTMTGYLSWARSNPVLATYGVPGRGAAAHFIGTEIARLGNTRLKSVAYKSLPSLIEDVAKGNIPATVTTRLSAIDLAGNPTLRVLALSSGKRWPDLDDLPTLLELGLADSPTVGSMGFFMASRTPDEKVAELREAVRVALQQPAASTAMHRAEVPPMPDQDDYGTLIAGERAEWLARINGLGFSADS